MFVFECGEYGHSKKPFCQISVANLAGFANLQRFQRCQKHLKVARENFEKEMLIKSSNDLAVEATKENDVKQNLKQIVSFRN